MIRTRFVVTAALFAVFVFLFALVAVPTTTSGYAKPVNTVLVQDGDPNDGDVQVAVEPGNLGRLSWGAVIAGAIVALILELMLNLLGIAVGATTISPSNMAENDTDIKNVGIGAIAWVAISTIISLFIGGWMASRFAGIPNPLDGMLHGIVTWGVVTLISMALLTSTLGRIISGVTSLVSRSLNAATNVAGTVARGATTAAGNVAAGAANTARNAAQGAANTAQNVASQAANQVSNSNPEIARAVQQRDVSMQSIMDEARRLISQAGVPQQQMQDQLQHAAQDVQAAAQQVAQNPQNADQVINDTIRRLLDRGQGVASQVDRDNAVQLLMQRGNMSEEQARQQIATWEESYGRVRTQAEQAAQQAQTRVREFGEQVQDKVEEVRQDAERAVRDAADTTTKAVAGLALAAFVAMLVGAFAAGLGGMLGTPENLPIAEVDTDNTSYIIQ
jgi:hypothetical protein